MASLDDMLANPTITAGLPDDAIPVHAVMIIEYVEPDSSNEPGRPRLALVSDDDLSAWAGLGMLRFACELELRSVRNEGLED